MELKQINMRLPETLVAAARSYAEHYGFRNVQELAAEALREKIMEESEFDETFTNEEIELIEKLAEISIKKGKLHSEQEIFDKLRA